VVPCAQWTSTFEVCPVLVALDLVVHEQRIVFVKGGEGSSLQEPGIRQAIKCAVVRTGDGEVPPEDDLKALRVFRRKKGHENSRHGDDTEQRSKTLDHRRFCGTYECVR